MWSYRVEGWSDPYATWDHDATIKVAADVDTELMLEEGARVLERALAEVAAHPRAGRRRCADAVTALRDTGRPAEARLQAGTSPEVRAELPARPLRDYVTSSRSHAWLVERERALYGAWYEIFPRSEGADPRPRDRAVDDAARFAPPPSGCRPSPTWASTSSTSRRSTRSARVNRKGPNNTLDAGEHDPGSPYAIGSAEGGHDAIHPDLGDFDDFDAFVAEARAARPGGGARHRPAVPPPTTPGSTTHPEWFTTRADGTIAYAENPPKKYQDIYPLNFDNDPAGRLRRGAPGHPGVDRPRRQDLPRRQPAHQAGGVLAVADRRRRRRPPRGDLAGRGVHPAGDDAHPRQGRLPAVLHLLRLAQPEVGARGVRAQELAGEAAAYMRPSFWPTTHDILTPYMQYGGPTAWKLRAALAATLVPTYGIYAGYELIEHVARPGAEEQIDNEKYEYKDRHWDDYEPGGPKEGQSLAPYLTQINQIRARAPGAALAAQHRASTTSTTRTSWRSPSAGAVDGARRHHHRRGQPRPARAPARRGSTSTCRRSGWATRTTLRGPRPDHRRSPGTGASTRSSGSAPTPNPCTSIQMRRF